MPRISLIQLTNNTRMGHDHSLKCDDISASWLLARARTRIMLNVWQQHLPLYGLLVLRGLGLRTTAATGVVRCSQTVLPTLRCHTSLNRAFLFVSR